MNTNNEKQPNEKRKEKKNTEKNTIWRIIVSRKIETCLF